MTKPRNLGPVVFRQGFTRVYATQADPASFTTIVGSGMGVSQTAGSLVVTTGTTANAETIIRSTQGFTGCLTLRTATTLSQRIANNNFYVELVDVIADNEPYVINSTTSVTVTVTAHGLTDINVGQSMILGNITGAAGLPGRYAIASVTTNTITFTVASWPATGTGTLNLFGYNYYQLLYTGTTPTQMAFDNQRLGYNVGSTNVTINTSAAPGHIAILTEDDNGVAILDQLSASATTTAVTQRGSAVRNIPSNSVRLYLQLRATNGTTNPASTTTWTVGFVAVDKFENPVVSIGGIGLGTQAASLPVAVTGGTAPNPPTGTASTPVQGVAARNTAAAGNPLYVATALTTNPVVATTGRNVDLAADVQGRLTVQLGNVPQLQDFATVTAVLTTTETTLLAAIASIRTGIHSLTIANRDSVVHTVRFRDTTGGTVRQSITVPAGTTVHIPYASGLWAAAVNTNWTYALTEVSTTAVEISYQSYRLGY